MKKIQFVFFFILLFNLVVKGQSDKKELSNIEIFSSKPGALIETEFIQLGYVDMIELRLMKVKDLVSGEIKSGLRFEYQTTNQVIAQTKLAVVDGDEVDGLISAVNTLITQILIYDKEVYTEVTFQCRSGFVTGGYYSPDKKKWISYIQLSKQDKNSTIVIVRDDYKHFLDLLKLAKEKM